MLLPASSLRRLTLLLYPQNRTGAYFCSLKGMLNIKSYNYGTLPSQVLIRKMEHEMTAEISSLLTQFLGSWRTSVIEVVEVKTKTSLEKLFFHRYQTVGRG